MFPFWCCKISFVCLSNLWTNVIYPWNSWLILDANACCRRISMAGLRSKTVPHLADAIHAAVTRIKWTHGSPIFPTFALYCRQFIVSTIIGHVSHPWTLNWHFIILNLGVFKNSSLVIPIGLCRRIIWRFTVKLNQIKSNKTVWFGLKQIKVRFDLRYVD